MRIEEFAERFMDITILPHQKRWLDHIHDHSHTLTLAPRGHGKSTMMVLYIVWRICHDPTLRILIASHKEELANTFARNIQMILERPDIQEEFGLRPGKPWRIGYSFFDGKRHPVIRTVAKQAGMTGGRFDIVVFDDLLTVANTRTEESRRRIESWIGTEVIPAIDPTENKKIIVIGTRKHIEDWYSKLLRKELYQCIVDRVYTDIDGERVYLWAERFDDRVIAELRQEMEPNEFAQEYMNNPVAVEGLRFKREWLKIYNTLPRRLDHELVYYMGIDPSMGSTRQRSSHMAIAVIAFDTVKEHIYVVDMYRGKHSLAEQLDIIIEWYQKYQPESVCIESCMANTFFADQVDEVIPRLIRVDYIHSQLKGTTAIKKQARIENIVGYLAKNGKLFIRDPKTHDFIKQFIEVEYIAFPEGEFDMLDALNLACDQIDMVHPFDSAHQIVYTF